MRFFTLLCNVSALLPTIFAGPLQTGVPIDVYAGEKTGKHIVVFSDSVAKGAALGQVSKLLVGKPGTGITNEYDAVFSGFAGNFDDTMLAALQLMPGVSSISEDGIVHALGIQPQTDAPWGLARISSREKLASANASDLAHTYRYDSTAGEGVDIYVIDTGIRVTHADFEGRADFGANFVNGSPNTDENGHGTHCAGTAVGRRYGVAKKAKAIAVKVLDGKGSGSTSDVIAGMDWVVKKVKLTRRPSVASMSLGGIDIPVNSALDEAARSLVNEGIHLIVAAGNSLGLENAVPYSPARVKEAITVGASDIEDQRAYFSNFGPMVDVFAPGVDITSAWNTDDTATNTISGTSMATPHVAGLVAYLLSVEGTTKTPAQMSDRIVELSNQANFPSLILPNRLAFNGVKAS